MVISFENNSLRMFKGYLLETDLNQCDKRTGYRRFFIFCLLQLVHFLRVKFAPYMKLVFFFPRKSHRYSHFFAVSDRLVCFVVNGIDHKDFRSSLYTMAVLRYRWGESYWELLKVLHSLGSRPFDGFEKSSVARRVRRKKQKARSTCN